MFTTPHSPLTKRYRPLTTLCDALTRVVIAYCSVVNTDSYFPIPRRFFKHAATASIGVMPSYDSCSTMYH
jgi:hypothetical protein